MNSITDKVGKKFFTYHTRAKHGYPASLMTRKIFHQLSLRGKKLLRGIISRHTKQS